MGLTLTTPPGAEPISLTETKAHLRIDHTTDDVLLGTLISAARDYVELRTERQIVAATYQYTLDQFPAEIKLPKSPLISVSSVQYVDSAGTTQTVAAAVYDVDDNSEPAVIREAYGQTWPTPRMTPNCVLVNFVVGYGAPFAAAAGSDVCTISGRTVADADIIRISTTDNDLPLPLAALTDYHVRDSTGATCKLAAAAGGAAIDITDAGTGTHFIGAIPHGLRAAMKMIVGLWYENREAYIDARPLVEVPMAVNSLLWGFSMPEARG